MLKIIKRNKFTILLGLILSIIFATIIILSQGRENSFILTPAKRNESFQVETNQNTNSNTGSFVQDTAQPEGFTNPTPTDSTEVESTGTIDYVKPIENVDEIISNLDPVTIPFTSDKGFVPRNTNGVQGQRLIWANNTDRIIKIIQIDTKYTNLPETIEIGPGQTYGLTLTEWGDWEFRETESGITGSIFVYKKKSTQN